MKKENSPTIIREGNTVVIIAHDPDGSLTREITRQISMNTKMELAKETLRRCPYPNPS